MTLRSQTPTTSQIHRDLSRAPRAHYLIPLPWQDRTRHLDYAKAHGLGLEVTAFCNGPALNDPATRKERLRGLKKDLRKWTQPLSFHGVFIDIVLHSIDDDIAAASRRRIERDLAAASELGCSRIVFHTGCNPNVPVPNYWDEVASGHSAFWPEVLERFPDITVCLENTYEPHPALFRRIMKKVNHPRLRVCLDVAHVNVFSEDGPERWFRQLGPWIAHMHWNDNRGDRDNHLAIGDGTVRWPEVWEESGELRCEVTTTLELGSLEAIQRSFRRLKALGMWNEPSADTR